MSAMTRPFKLPEITFPLSIDTIGKALATGHEMRLCCHTEGCNNDARINLVQLGYRLGFDHGSLQDDLKRFFYCSKCREAGRPDKNISFRLHAPTEGFSPWPREHFEPDGFKRGR